MLKEKEGYVRNFMGFLDVWMAWLAYHITLSVLYSELAFIVNKDILVTNIFIFFVWYGLSKLFHLNELYRSRPYSVILYNCLAQGLLGAAMLSFLLVAFNLYYPGLKIILVFAGVSIFFCSVSKIFIYSLLKVIRKRGMNTRNVLFVGDKTGLSLLQMIHERYEWGYRILGVVGDDTLKKLVGDHYPVYNHGDVDFDTLISGKSIDEVIYACEYDSMREVKSLMDSCHEIGVTFRLYSPFLNMLTSNTHIHYFDTHAVLTVSNTPNDFLMMKMKRLVDIILAGTAILLLMPVYLLIALVIKLDSRGPVLFSQKRVGLRGRRFMVHKFRTMVVNADAMKQDLMGQNEMDGPVFKIANDPRITRCGRFLRKTSLDELPQFFNVLFGDMSIVGPRPPVPAEVVQYERWQLRRLSMRPGITCLWQIAPSRNDISFEDWMRLDMEYIDNWSLRLDFIIILKTIRTVLRADGK